MKCRISALAFLGLCSFAIGEPRVVGLGNRPAREILAEVISHELPRSGARGIRYYSDGRVMTFGEPVDWEVARFSPAVVAAFRQVIQGVQPLELVGTGPVGSTERRPPALLTKHFHVGNGQQKIDVAQRRNDWWYEQEASPAKFAVSVLNALDAAVELAGPFIAAGSHPGCRERVIACVYFGRLIGEGGIWLRDNGEVEVYGPNARHVSVVLNGAVTKGIALASRAVPDEVSLDYRTTQKAALPSPLSWWPSFAVYEYPYWRTFAQVREEGTLYSTRHPAGRKLATILLGLYSAIAASEDLRVY